MARSAVLSMESPKKLDDNPPAFDSTLLDFKQPTGKKQSIRLGIKASKTQFFPNLRTPKNGQKIVEYAKIVEAIQDVHVKEDVQIIGFTGVGRGQGVSTLLAILGSLIAEENTSNSAIYDLDETQELDLSENEPQGVFLLDACFNHPSLHKIFGVENIRGLSGLLKNKGLKEIKATNLVNYHLDMLPAGEKAAPPYRWDRFTALLKKLRERKQFIFIDVPPVSEDSESLRICKLCDAVIVPVRANDKRYEAINGLNKMLQDAGVNVLGSVLTNRKYFIPEWIYKRI